MCCLFGIYDYGLGLTMKQKNRLLSALSAASEVRGTDATGIAYHGGLSGQDLCIYKRPLPGRWMRFKVPADTVAVMGHTRMATQGSAKRNRNNHPFLGHTEEGDFALAHNGVLYNDDLLRDELNLPKTKIETDSFVSVQLLEQQGQLNTDTLRTMAELVRGTFTFTVLDKDDTLHIVKGDNPFALYHFPKRKLYAYASTKEILTQALERVNMTGGQEVPVSCGEILQIRADGRITRDQFDDSALLMGTTPWWRSWWHETPEPSVDQLYLEELRSVATAFGYTRENIDSLLQQGFTTDEIEEFLYCGEY